MPISNQVSQHAPRTIPAADTRRLAYLVSGYPLLSETFVLREVLSLRRLGFQVDVASVNSPDRPGNELAAAEASEAARAYYLKKHGVAGATLAHIFALATKPAGYLRGGLLALRLGGLDLQRLFFNLMYFTEALMVGRWMRRMHHTHLHCHLGQQASTIGLFARGVFGVGFSITVHGPDEFFDARRHYLAEKIAAAEFICCISSFARSQLMRYAEHAHWNKLVVSRLGADPQVFTPRLSRRSPETFEILCVGRIVPAKGQHLLIDAVERLVLEGRKVRLHLVGRGPEEPSLRQHAAQIVTPGHVVFEGAVNQDRIRDLYEAADIFCLPSFAEGIPVVLMEAMAMGIPCVTTCIAGIPELIRDGIDGLLVAPADLDALTCALARLMDSPDLCERMARSAHERILEDYDLDKNVEALACIFTQRIPALPDVG